MGKQISGKTRIQSQKCSLITMLNCLQYLASWVWLTINTLRSIYTYWKTLKLSKVLIHGLAYEDLEKSSKALRDFECKLECITWADWCLPCQQGFQYCSGVGDMKSYFGFQLSKECWPICLSKGFHNGTQASLCLSQAPDLGCRVGLRFWRGCEATVKTSTVPVLGSWRT